jgi:D-glycero-D-manno-heptose 1,7-bisphosphate phosphatase
VHAGSVLRVSRSLWRNKISPLNEKRWFQVYKKSRDSSAKTPAIFLDRDGVIIQDKHYLKDPAQVELYPGVAGKLKSFLRFEIPIVVVTNQSGIGQDFFGWAEYNLVNQRLLDLMEVYQPFTAVYANAHLPSETEASWRKPNPGMILQAASDLNICLASSVMVGDRWVDLEAANRAGVEHLVHVKTGHGVHERPRIISDYPRVELVKSLAHLNLDSFSKG